MSKTHYLPNDKFHFFWNHTNEPAVKIKSGDTVVMESLEVSDNQISPQSTVDEMEGLDWDRFYPLAGPVYVEGAEPGDTLAIEILNVHPAGWGWGAIFPDMNLLEGEFESYLRIFDLSDGKYIHFREDIKIPIEPSIGTMGLCPKGAADLTPVPPRNCGGNIDIRYLREGTTLYLPVEDPGGLFSCADGHAAIGNGEVSGAGVECGLYVSYKFTLLKGKSIPAPQYKTTEQLTPKVNDKGFFGTTGVDTDLYKASQKAIRAMLDHITEKYNMTREDAYILASLCVDIHVSEIVNDFVVSALLPMSIFKK